MEKGFYHPDIGYWQTNSEPTQEILNGYPKGTKEVSLKPGDGYNYNGTKWIAPTQEWLDDKAAKAVRAKRDFLLKKELDPVVTNPLRWASMSEAQKQAVADYRQSLLDITSQVGFPHEVVWPVKPF